MWTSRSILTVTNTKKDQNISDFFLFFFKIKKVLELRVKLKFYTTNLAQRCHFEPLQQHGEQSPSRRASTAERWRSHHSTAEPPRTTARSPLKPLTTSLFHANRTGTLSVLHWRVCSFRLELKPLTPRQLLLGFEFEPKGMQKRKPILVLNYLVVLQCFP